MMPYFGHGIVAWKQFNEFRKDFYVGKGFTNTRNITHSISITETNMYSYALTGDITAYTGTSKTGCNSL